MSFQDLGGVAFNDSAAQYPPQPELDEAVSSVKKQYPTLAPHFDNSVVKYGIPNGPQDNRQLEFYHPWEDDNPHPGKTTLEVFNRDLRGNDLQETIAGDMLHRLGGLDPKTGQPIDPTWYALKQELGSGRQPQDLELDQRAYQREVTQYGPMEYKDWDHNSRLDAYVRAAVFPNQNPEWKGFMTPQQEQTAAKMQNYLRGGVHEDLDPQGRGP